MQTKTKVIIIGSIVGMCALSTLMGEKQAPKDPKAAVQATALFECSGALNYLAVNTPSMPDDYRTDHQTIASAMAEGARAMKTGVDEVEPYDAGTKRAKKLLDVMDTKGIVQMMQQCEFNAKDILSNEKTQAQQLKPEDMPRKDSRDPLLEEKERKAAKEAELQKQREEDAKVRRGAALSLYKCSGLFMSATEAPGISQNNKMAMGNHAAITWKLAKTIDSTIDPNEVNKVVLDGGVEGGVHIQNNDIKGMTRSMEDCFQVLEYVRDQNIGGVAK